MSTNTCLPSPLSAHQAIEAFAQNPNRPHRNHFINNMKIGDFIRQGDIYCLRIERPARNWVNSPNRNLARRSSSPNGHLVDGSGVEIKIQNSDLCESIRGKLRHTLTQSLKCAVKNHSALLTFLDLSDVRDDQRMDQRVIWWDICGPQIVAKNRFTITHPEHAHFSLPAGVYQAMALR